MSDVTLVVTEAGRAIGEFRRRWVRPMYALYLRHYRKLVARAIAHAGERCAVLVGRDVIDASTMSPAIRLMYYDEAAFHGDAAALSALTHRLVASWWPAEQEEPALTVNGVWIPALLPISKALLLRLEVVEYVGALERALDELRPARVLLVTGRSIPERIAAGLAAERGLPASRAGAGYTAARVAPAGRARRRAPPRCARGSSAP